ncbi:MAG: hypothetical protein C0407_00550 [Desulfobacca sp.]|nr:hypothetical protein [Desulfobacca sp.]
MSPIFVLSLSVFFYIKTTGIGVSLLSIVAFLLSFQLIRFHPEIRISGWKHLDIQVNSRQKPFFNRSISSTLTGARLSRAGGFLGIDKAGNCMFSSGKVVSG